MTTHLSKLTAAADKWEGMAGEFKKLEKQYKSDVQSVSLGRTWTGVSADAASVRFDVTLKEFQAAQKEAKAISSLLRDAHTNFVDLRGKVRSARQDAIAAGMKVSDQGIVTHDFEKLTEGEKNAIRHDPSYQESVRKSIASWSQQIEVTVRALKDADEGVRIALEAVVIDSNITDGTANGFNSQAKGDIEKYEAEAAHETATKLNNGDAVSAKEISGLQRAFRDNSGNKAFSQTLLNALGAGGTIQLTNRLNDLIHVHSAKGRPDYAALENGLANTLATATRNTKSDWYQEWRSDMKNAGKERYQTEFSDARLDKVRGYQSLVTLMSKADENGASKDDWFSPQFLKDLGDDMIKAEKDDSDIWTLKGEYDGKRDGWFANDPVDGLLGVMSHDPATAASFLKDDDRMKHLMDDERWQVILREHEGAKASTYTPSIDADDRTGFGAALQAGATGIDPSDEGAKHVEHSKDNNAVFKSSIKYLADSGDEFPSSLRDPMTQVLVNHGSTVHESASNPDMNKAPIPQDQLFEVIKQVSKDQDSYGDLNRGINHALVADIHESGQKDPHDSLVRTGRTVGFLEAARTHAAGDPETAAFDQKWIVDQAISYIPVGSGEVQSGVDYVTEKWLEDEQKKIDDKNSDENVDSYKKRNGQLMALAHEWSLEHGGKNDSTFGPQADIDEAANAGGKLANGVSGEKTE
ncbi:hypothetical protein [Streptomyces sp. A5-4]|uniref:hypothetical protein n=1 Tax=Streptomyces sp. A5-4 TaxID=3384771 RepID=UPI003DA83D0E